MRTRLSDLAIFGGPPAFTEPLHVGRPNIGNRERLLQRINDLLDKRWLTNDGPYVQELEHRISDLLNVRHCVAMCNGTTALEVAIRAADLSGEVIVPSFTFVATAHALQWQGITPIFCDVAQGTSHLDPSQVEQLITPRTTGIIGVHLWGMGYETDALARLAQRHGLQLLYDAAHAFACSHQGSMIGNFGDIEVFSFHATKFFNTFEGGAATTNDDDLARKMRSMRNFGFAGYDTVESVGTNGKMSEVSAAMGLTVLEDLDRIVQHNYRNYLLYKNRLDELPGVRFVSYDENEKNNFQYVVLEIDEAVVGTSRDVLVDVLLAENILARRYFYPGCHQMEPYRSLYPHAGKLLPHTKRLVTQVMSLPNGTAVDADDIERLCDILVVALNNAPEIDQRLRSQ